MRLRTSHPDRPGYQRVRHARGFRYLAPDGTPVNGEELDRVKALAVPPAWNDVWICPYPNGHLQAVGTDAAGRHQYLYHPEFRTLQEEAKHDHVREAARCLPTLRAAVEQDLAANVSSHAPSASWTWACSASARTPTRGTTAPTA